MITTFLQDSASLNEYRRDGIHRQFAKNNGVTQKSNALTVALVSPLMNYEEMELTMRDEKRRGPLRWPTLSGRCLAWAS
jgi:hypothetical protein